MKIVGLAAGRKNGNSELLMKHAMLTMREQLDLEFTIIRLSDLDIEHCSGCETKRFKKRPGSSEECRRSNPRRKTQSP